MFLFMKLLIPILQNDDDSDDKETQGGDEIGDCVWDLRMFIARPETLHDGEVEEEEEHVHVPVTTNERGRSRERTYTESGGAARAS
ncbi:hypothetical protein HF086_004584 [Spodoptera exigua]|uniref:Uncharacterized protein n=1 Tax=Spodoptera exigua TaxID=7107 RepID=A0A922MRU4_SPOEX|nr:hypothetical protein HF086_004584 [Spodoptera exigua]